MENFHRLRRESAQWLMAVLTNAKIDLGDAIDTPAVSDVDQESDLDAVALREGELFED